MRRTYDNSRPYYKSGDNNRLCDHCTLTYKKSELRRNWLNNLVCKTCYDPKPAEFKQPPNTYDSYGNVRDARDLLDTWNDD